MRLLGVLLALFLLSGFPPIVSAQIGPEFRVNIYTTSIPSRPDIADDGTGNFVVVWESQNEDGFDFGIFGRRFDSAGDALGGDFQVNTHTAFDQAQQAIAVGGAGSFLVVWSSENQDGDDDGIFGQRYDSTGSVVGGEFQVNTYTTGDQSRPDVAADAAGGFVVVWDSRSGQDGSGYGVFGQRYDSAGSALGGEFQVSTYDPDGAFAPAVATDAGGDFVVVWQRVNVVDSRVLGQRFDSGGTALGAEFQISSEHNGNVSPFSAVVAAHGAGNFTVVWGESPPEIRGQRYDGAAQQGVRGHFLRFVDRVDGRRFVRVGGKEAPSNSTVLGAPVTYGATVQVIAHGDNDQEQTFTLPPGASGPGGIPGWRATSTGWRYEDRLGVNGPVKRVIVEMSARRTFVLRVIIEGTASSPPPGVGLVPPGNGTEGGASSLSSVPAAASTVWPWAGPTAGR